MDGNAFTHHWEAGRSRPDRRSSRQWGNPGKKERSVVRRRDGNQKWSDNRRWQAPCAPQVGAGPLRTGRSTSRHGRVRRGEKGTASRGGAEWNWVLTKSGFLGGFAKGWTREEVAPSESEPHWVTAQSRNRITFRERGTTGSGRRSSTPPRLRPLVSPRRVSPFAGGASSSGPNGGVDNGPSDEPVDASEPSPAWSEYRRR